MARKPRKADNDAPDVITIKKYANRRLYNTAESSYVTLDDLATMVQDGVDFTVRRPWIVAHERHLGVAMSHRDTTTLTRHDERRRVANGRTAGRSRAGPSSSTRAPLCVDAGRTRERTATESTERT